jgi:hypothetical protein
LNTVSKPAPPRNGTGLPPHHLAALRHALLEQHRAHREQLSRLETPGTAPGADRGDRALRALRRVARALAFMDMGIYGVCLSCGMDIPLDRLQAVPAARRCGPCQGRRSEARALPDTHSRCSTRR